MVHAYFRPFDTNPSAQSTTTTGSVEIEHGGHVETPSPSSSPLMPSRGREGGGERGGGGRRTKHCDASGRGGVSRSNPNPSLAAGATTFTSDYARWGASAGAAAAGGNGGGGSNDRMPWPSSLPRRGRGGARMGGGVGLGAKIGVDDGQRSPGGGSNSWLNEADADLSDIKATMRRIDGAHACFERGI